MARKTKSPAKPKTDPRELQPYWTPNDAEWGGFVNIRLDDSQREAYAEWEADNAQYAPQVVDELLAAGMKIGLSYDADNQCYICTFTGALVSVSDMRFVMTTRAGTMDEVLALSVWKHTQVAHGDYGDFRPRTGKFDSWG
jgi:hypothetical protein